MFKKVSCNYKVIVYCFNHILYVVWACPLVVSQSEPVCAEGVFGHHQGQGALVEAVQQEGDQGGQVGLPGRGGHGGSFIGPHAPL